MPTSVQSGTTAALTVGTETTLGTTDTSNHDYILALDLGAMALGDVIEVRIYTILLAAGTERVAYMRRYKHVQAEPIKYSVPVPADISFRATLKQVSGTGRAIPWKILSP